MKKEATYALASSYQTVNMPKVVGKLYKVPFGRIVTLSGFRQIG
jgi:hypothetical protein